MSDKRLRIVAPADKPSWGLKPSCRAVLSGAQAAGCPRRLLSQVILASLGNDGTLCDCVVRICGEDIE